MVSWAFWHSESCWNNVSGKQTNCLLKIRSKTEVWGDSSRLGYCWVVLSSDISELLCMKADENIGMRRGLRVTTACFDMAIILEVVRPTISVWKMEYAIAKQNLPLLVWIVLRPVVLLVEFKQILTDKWSQWYSQPAFSKVGHSQGKP